MNFIEGKCPSCDGILQIPEEKDSLICMYCGEEIGRESAVAHFNGVDVTDSNVFQEYYETGKEGMAKIMWAMEDPMKRFKKNTYEEAFYELYAVGRPIFEAIDKAYREKNKDESLLKEMAGFYAEAAKEKLDQLNAKRQKEMKLMDYNFMTAAYIVPAIVEYKGDSSELLADFVLEEWMSTFPKTNLKKSNFENIQSGFKKKLCYITTAVCETFGKPDDCYELNILRQYRDGYLLNQPDGEEIVAEYYDIAPTIVKRIQKRENAPEIFEGVWTDYLSECVKYIENDQNEECKELYIKMVQDLRKEYQV